MAGKGTVGKLSVKVVPDLSDFAKKLRRDLKRIQKQVKDLDLTFNAEVKLDKESLKKASEEAAKSDVRFKAEVDLKSGQLEALRKKIQQIKSEVKVNANLSEEQKKKLEERLDSIRAAVSLSTRPGDLAKLKRDVERAAGDVKAGLTVNERSFRQFQARLNKLKADVSIGVKLDPGATMELRKRIEALKADVDVHAKLSEEQKKKIKHELSKLDGKVTVNADLDDGKARFDLKRLTHPRWVDIHVRLAKTSLARVAAQLKALAGGNVFESIGRNLNDFLKNLDTAAVKMGAVSTLIGSAISVVGSGLGVFSSLAVGLAKSTPALLALPGIFGAAAAGAGVLIAALKDAKTVLEDLGPSFQNLQTQISGAYWEQAAQPIRDFANVALQELSPALQSIASNLGSMTAAIAGAAGGHIAGFQQSLTYLSQALAIGSTGAASFTNGILTMGEVGAKYLPNIAQWANNLAASFEAWATKAAESGKMDQSIQAAAKAFGTLKDITVDLGGIIGGLFKAMANGSAPIDSIADALDKANKAVNGPLFQATLTNLFSSMGRAAGSAFQGVGKLGEAFVSLEPTLGVVLPLIGETLRTALTGLATALENPAFQDGLANFFNSLLVAVQALAPAMPSLGEAFGAIATVAGTLLEAIAPLVAQLVEGLAPIFQQLVPILVPVIEQLGAALLPVIQALVPVISEIIAQLAPLIAEYLPQVLPPIVSLVQTLAAALIPAIQLVGQTLQWLMPLAMNIWNTLVAVITGAIQAIKGILQTVMALIKGDWSGAWNGIKAIGEGVWNIIAGLIKIFGSNIENYTRASWNAVWNAIKGAWNSITSTVSSAISWVRNIISSGWSYVSSITSSMWSGIVSTVSSWVNNMLNTVRNIPNSIRNVFAGAGSWLWNAGRNVIQGFLNGINSMFGAVKNKLSSLTSYLPSWKGPAPVDRVILKDAGQLVMQGFINGLESQYGAVRKSLQGFTEDLQKDVAPHIAASVSTSFEKTKPSKDRLNAIANSTLQAGQERRPGGSVTIVNNYPQAQRDSKTRDDVADGIRLASSI